MTILANISDMGDPIGKSSVCIIFLITCEIALFDDYFYYVDDFIYVYLWCIILQVLLIFL
jgi:hypothetical protein